MKRSKVKCAMLAILLFVSILMAGCMEESDQRAVVPKSVELEWKDAEKLGEHEYRIKVGQTVDMQVITTGVNTEDGDYIDMEIPKVTANRDGILTFVNNYERNTITAVKPGLVTLNVILSFENDTHKTFEYKFNVVFHVVDENGETGDEPADFEIDYTPKQPPVGTVVQSSVVEGLTEEQLKFGTWRISYTGLDSGEVSTSLGYSSDYGSPIGSDGTFMAYKPCVANVSYRFEGVEKSFQVRFGKESDFTVSLYPSTIWIKMGETFTLTPVFGWADPSVTEEYRGPTADTLSSKNVYWDSDNHASFRTGEGGRVIPRMPGTGRVSYNIPNYNDEGHFRQAFATVHVLPADAPADSDSQTTSVNPSPSPVAPTPTTSPVTPTPTPIKPSPSPTPTPSPVTPTPIKPSPTPEPPPKALSLSPQVLPAAKRLIPYSQPLTISGGKAPYALELAGGTLPQGIELGQAALFGTPTGVAGSYPISIRVTDSQGSTLVQQYDLIVNEQTEIIGDKEIVLTTGYFDTTRGYTLRNADGASLGIDPAANTAGAALQAGENDSYTLTVPAGLTLGSYTVRLKTDKWNAVKDVTITVLPRPFVPPVHTPVKNITVRPTVIIEKQSVTLNATVQPSNATKQKIEWSIVEGHMYASVKGNTLTSLGGGTGFGNEPVLRATITGGGKNGTDYHQDFPITINYDLGLSPEGLSNGKENTEYRQSFTVFGGNGSYSYSFNGTLPEGLQFSTDTDNNTLFYLEGTPGQGTAGEYSLSIVVADDTGYSKTFDYTLHIAPVHTPVTNITGLPTIITAGQTVALNATVQPSGATKQEIAWSIIGGETYASVSGNQLTGIQATPDGNKVTLLATIEGGGEDGQDFTQSFEITVQSDLSLSPSPGMLIGIKENQPYSQRFNVSGGSGSYKFALSSALPQGLQFNADPANGAGALLSGTPASSTAGGHMLSIMVTDDTDYSKTFNYTLHIVADSTFDALSSIAGPEAVAPQAGRDVYHARTGAASLEVKSGLDDSRNTGNSDSANNTGNPDSANKTENPDNSDGTADFGSSDNAPDSEHTDAPDGSSDSKPTPPSSGSTDGADSPKSTDEFGDVQDSGPGNKDGTTGIAPPKTEPESQKPPSTKKSDSSDGSPAANFSARPQQPPKAACRIQ